MASSKLTGPLWKGVDRVDAKLVPFLRTVAVPLLRISLGGARE